MRRSWRTRFLKAGDVLGLVSCLGAMAGCQPSGESAGSAMSALAAVYRGEYKGDEEGTVGCTISSQGQLSAWAQSPSAGRFTGAGPLRADGSVSYSVHGTGMASSYAITFEGTFDSSASGRRGTGTWRSSSGYTGTWTVMSGGLVGRWTETTLRRADGTTADCATASAATCLLSTLNFHVDGRLEISILGLLASWTYDETTKRLVIKLEGGDAVSFVVQSVSESTLVLLDEKSQETGTFNRND